MFDDGFYVHPQNGAALADNAAFVLNALDNLGGDPALTELRSRAPAARPMERVDDLREAARTRLFAEQQRLEDVLKDAEGRLSALEARRAGGAASTPEELAEIEQLSRRRRPSIRKQLRGVEREFRRDIDALDGQLVFLNVWLPPIFVGADRRRRVRLAQPQARRRGMSAAMAKRGAQDADDAWRRGGGVAALLGAARVDAAGAGTAALRSRAAACCRLCRKPKRPGARHGDDGRRRAITSCATPMAGCWRRRATIPSPTQDRRS